MSDTHSETVFYVADNMLPGQAAPSETVGAWAWVRANLLSSVTNTILTAAALLAVIGLIVGLGPWFWNAVWDAESLSECREILDGRTGACFALLTERWHQFAFGFYPYGETWRLWLALALFFVACVPVLGDGWVRRFMLLSLLYPVVAFFLIWGGSIWPIVAFVVGPVLGYVAFRVTAPLTSTAIGFLAGLVVTLLYWVDIPFTQVSGMGIVSGLLRDAFGFVGLRPIESAQVGGFFLGMIIGVSGIVLSFPIGILLALGRQSNLPIVKALCVGFIEFIRGVPLITLLFVASVLLQYFLPPGITFDVLLRVIILVTLFSAAYIAEVIRGGLASIPRGQYEAAQSLGLPYWDSMRLIILPQALKVAIPGIVGTFIGLFKDTTLVSFVGLFDVLGIRQPITSDQRWLGIIWEPLVFAAILFFIFCFAMSRYAMYMERKLDTGHRS